MLHLIQYPKLPQGIFITTSTSHDLTMTIFISLVGVTVTTLHNILYSREESPKHKQPQERCDMATVTDPPSKYACVMCKGWLEVPYLTECCGQQFCKTCLEGPTPNASNICPLCETGEPEFKYIMYKPLKEEIDNLPVPCPCKTNGCDKIIRRADCAEHEQVCGYLVIDCSKCMGHLLRKELSNHLKSRCPKRQVKCLHCKEVGSYDDITGKHQSFCPEVEVQCRQCEAIFKRKESRGHKAECPEEEYTCPFSEAGCEVTLKRKDLEGHLSESVPHHLSLLMSAYLSIKQELQTLKNERTEKF